MKNLSEESVLLPGELSTLEIERFFSNHEGRVRSDNTHQTQAFERGVCDSDNFEYRVGLGLDKCFTVTALLDGKICAVKKSVEDVISFKEEVPMAVYATLKAIWDKFEEFDERCPHLMNKKSVQMGRRRTEKKEVYEGPFRRLSPQEIRDVAQRSFDELSRGESRTFFQTGDNNNSFIYHIENDGQSRFEVEALLRGRAEAVWFSTKRKGVYEQLSSEIKDEWRDELRTVQLNSKDIVKALVAIKFGNVDRKKFPKRRSRRPVKSKNWFVSGVSAPTEYDYKRIKR